MHSKPQNRQLQKPLKEAFFLIKKNKRIFFLIFLLQLIFFLIVIIAGINYIPKIVENAKNMLDYSEKLGINAENLGLDILQQKNTFEEDQVMISRNYDSIRKNLYYLLSYIFLAFAVVNGLAWYFASNISEKKKKMFSLKNILIYLLKFFVLSAVLGIFLCLLAYSIIKVFLSGYVSVNPINFLVLLLGSVLMIYFIYIGIPLLNFIRLKDLPKKILLLGIKRFVQLMGSYLLVIIFIAASLLLISYLVELNLLLLLIAVLFSVSVFAWAKIYFSATVEKLSGL